MSSLHRQERLLDIAGAGNPEELRKLREEEQNRLASVLSSSPVIQVIEELNELHDAVIVRILELAEIELARSGFGKPPVPYAYLLFGSGGRSEQTMSSDQDSGIVYGVPENGAEAERCCRYFRSLGRLVVERLVETGYPPCEGNVIASNPDWCLSIADWEQKLDGWFNEPSWEHVRYLLIVADGRFVYGDAELAARWKQRFYRDVLHQPVIAQRMMENTLRHKVLIGVFGQLLTESYGESAGSLDIKYGAYIPMVNVFRLLAVQAGIRETSTFGRIRALREAGKLAEQEAQEASEAFALFLRLRLMSMTKIENGQWVGTGKLPVKQLSHEWIKPLKKALRLGRKLQRQLEKGIRDRFGGR
ncbi:MULTISPECIES: DUF294 nucleotidyltransferase-like domain-containing protein [Cohnella]|jgi:CBS domain-containing protein|uniref:DUF294 nucleotidyltransferase-like domain-containing protein n=1 Tax=Cohnella TaxID=329857 RepID=UPI00036C40A8|nr:MULTISPECIES: DUF294 nucleotidyltransferase-like domain-containing protein [Cohnella]REK63139.1 MAG: hypothetical protein C6P35_14975 [Cohnella sp.]